MKRYTESKLLLRQIIKKLGGVAVGTAISCGVDSLYTVKKYVETSYPSQKLTHLFITSANAELWDTKDGDLHKWESDHTEAFDRFNRVSEELKLPLVKVYTNFTWYILNRDWKKYHHLYTHHYITMSLVLILRKLWRIYYFSSTVDFTHFNLKDNSIKDTDKHELLSMHILGLSDFTCYSGGAEATRIQKTLALTEFPIARETLHPCHKQGKINCSDPTCGKCLRALLTLDYYDKLDTMKEVFDIDRYKREKKHYFWRLAAGRNDEFLVDLYKMISQKYPEEMEKAVVSYEMFVQPVSAADHRVLQRAYAMVTDLLSLDKPKERVKQYFENKNIHKVYCSGTSNIGCKITSWLEDDIEIIDYRSGNFEDCDMALILSTRESDISSKRAILRKRACKDIISLYELSELLKSEL